MTRTEDHLRMLLPCQPPLAPAGAPRTRPAIPALWDRAKEMFSAVLTHIGSTAGFSKRLRFRRPDRRDLLLWLVPVEKLVRSCLITRALTWLLMTPQGRKLLRDTPKMAIPDPPKPVGERPRHKITIPHPGWHTIAQPWRPEPTPAPKPPAAPADPYDPASWAAASR